MKNLLLFLMLLSTSRMLFGQVEIQGKITDLDGANLVGASIQIVETQQGVSSDASGNYAIKSVSSGNYTLQISYIGYETQTKTISVNANAGILKHDFSLNEKSIAFDQIVVRSTRATEKLPITYTSIEKEEIEANNLGQDVPFILKWTPSTVVTSDAGTGIGYTGLRIRGIDPSRINVTINGIPLNDSESQNVFWVDLPDFTSSTDNIQIQRGVGTSTNGPAAFGATINLNTSVLHKEAYGQISSSVGSFDTRRANVSFGTGLINDHFTIDGRVSRLKSDGYIDRSTADLESYYVSAAHIGRKSSLRFNIFSGHEVTYQAWNGVPAQYIVNEDADANLRTFNSSGTDRPGEPHDNEVDDYQQNHFQVLYNAQLNRNWDFSLAGNYTKGKGFFELYKGGEDLAGYKIQPVVIGNETITESDLIERRWLDNDFYFASLASNYTSDNQKLNVNLGTALGVYNGDHYGEVIWARFAGNTEQDHRYYENDATKTDFNIFSKASYQLNDKLIGFLDLQYRRIGYDLEGDDKDGKNLKDEETFNFFNPKFGLTYALNSKTNLYAYFGVGNREPNRSDFTDSSPTSRPKHETVYDTEIGIKKNWDKAIFEANLYYMDYKNQLALTGQINDVGENARINIPDSYRAGLELVGGWQMTKSLNVEGALTLSSNKISEFKEYIDNWDTGIQKEVNHGKTDLSFSPNSIFNAVITYEAMPDNPNQQLSFSLSNKNVGKQFIDNTSNENTTLDAYNFTDFRLAYSVKTSFVKELAITLLVRNIFDAKYSTNAWTYRYISEGYDARPNDPAARLEQGSTYNLTGFYPQAGRNFLLGLSLNF
jgi:iron complex outermembrane receptor protein